MEQNNPPQENPADEIENSGEELEASEESAEENAEAASSENGGGELIQVQKKLKEYEDMYLRTHADFENTKKRLEKEKYQMIEYASEKFAKDLLPVLDALEMALSSSRNEEAESNELLTKMQEGIGHTIDNFLKVFGKHGIELIDTAEGFDPHLHEAVMQQPSDDHEEGQIIQILQKGYKYKERVLRPAMVSICKK